MRRQSGLPARHQCHGAGGRHRHLAGGPIASVKSQPVFVMARPDGREIWVFAFPTTAGCRSSTPSPARLPTPAARPASCAWVPPGATGSGCRRGRQPGRDLRHRQQAPPAASGQRPSTASSSHSAAPSRIGHSARGATDATGFRLLSDFQRGFPLVAEPWSAIAQARLQLHADPTSSRPTAP